jgi:hypothetical protein
VPSKSTTTEVQMNPKHHAKGPNEKWLHSLPSPKQVAKVLGGEVVGGNQILAPGPGHSPKDRSLSIKLEASPPWDFLVHSFAGDDPIRCKDYIREKLGLPAWTGSAKR